MPSDVVALIKAKQAEIAKLQAELDEARAALVGKPIVETRSKRVPGPTPLRARRSRRRRAKLAGDIRSADVLPSQSVAIWAAAAIKQSGKPMHVRDILKAVEQQGHKIKQTTLVGSLSRWVERRVFYRAGPNVFGLAEMRKV
jgi:hypothetical protein